MRKKASRYLLYIILAGLLLVILLIFFKQENLKSNRVFADKITNSQPSIERTIEQYEADLMKIDGVIGLGISECQKEFCIRVYLENDTPELKAKIPAYLGQFKVDTEIIGSVEALPQR